MTSRRPTNGQDGLGKRITISFLASTPPTAMIRPGNCFRALRGGSSPLDIFVESQYNETPLLQLFIVMIWHLASYQYLCQLGDG
jgi:hypothetical protein